jgi:hypothetical protein
MIPTMPCEGTLRLIAEAYDEEWHCERPRHPRQAHTKERPRVKPRAASMLSLQHQLSHAVLVPTSQFDAGTVPVLLLGLTQSRE